MTNHVHLVVQTPEADLGRGMHRLNGLYAQWFNWRWDLDGHLFQGRFGSEMIETELRILETARYVVLNPVRARMCSVAEQWPWSSHRAMIGRVRPPDFLAVDELLAYFGRSPTAAGAAYEQFVREGQRRAARDPSAMSEGLSP
jgi:hypothetical protein